MRYLLAIALLSGCIRDELVDCGGDIACPAGTACATLDDELFCVPSADVDACIDHDEFEGCQLAEGELGACYDAMPSRVCLPAGCGNGLPDPGELCDDENGVVGDGCSANCLSDETCGNGIVDSVKGEQCDDGDLIGHDGCSSSCTPEALEWTPVPFGLPSEMFWQASTYDAARRRVVLFGGAFQRALGLQVARGETWEWDGVGFMRRVTSIAPSARWAHSLVYDPVRRRSVLFGGASSGAELAADTWEWDGDVWTPRTSAVLPPRRQGAASAYDPERERVVIFGGRSGATTLDDMWEWDGTTWAPVPTSIPGRAFAAMTYDPRRGVMVLAGGLKSNGSVAETWERRGGQWMMIAATPAYLDRAMIADDGVGILAFGGFLTGQSAAVTWRWDGTAWTTLTATGAPSGRELAALCRHPISGRVLLVGGHFTSTLPQASNTYGDAYTWDGATRTWTAITPAAVPGRALHATAYDSLRGKLVVFGGATTFTQVLPSSDTLELDGGHWAVRSPAVTPGPRLGAAMAFDAARGESVMFGGRFNFSTLYDETWLWNGTRWQQMTPAIKPSVRELAASAYDPVRKRVVLFGGTSGSNAFGDTWEWDGTTWIQLMPASPPPARFRASMTYDPLRRRVVLVGGSAQGPPAELGDAWEWDGATWTQIGVPQEPTGRGSTGLTWHGIRGSLVMFGGVIGTFGQMEDTWELTGSTWTQHPTGLHPDRRHGHSLTPMVDGSGLIAFGGLTNAGSGVNELWQLRWNNSGPHERCSLDVDDDADGLAGCNDSDCWSRCTPLCPPGATCDPSWPRCGDGGCNAALEDCRLCPSDCTCTPVCGDTFCDPGEACPGDC